MAHDIASKEIAIAVGKAGMTEFFGTGGLGVEALKKLNIEGGRKQLAFYAHI